MRITEIMDYLNRDKATSESEWSYRYSRIGLDDRDLKETRRKVTIQTKELNKVDINKTLDIFGGM